MRRNIIPVGTVLQVRTVSVTVTSKCKVVRIYRYTGILDSSLVYTSTLLYCEPTGIEYCVVRSFCMGNLGVIYETGTDEHTDMGYGLNRYILRYPSFLPP